MTRTRKSPPAAVVPADDRRELARLRRGYVLLYLREKYPHGAMMTMLRVRIRTLYDVELTDEEWEADLAYLEGRELVVVNRRMTGTSVLVSVKLDMRGFEMVEGHIEPDPGVQIDGGV